MKELVHKKQIKKVLVKIDRDHDFDIACITRSTALDKISAATSISSSVVNLPILIRKAPSTKFEGNLIACKTCDGDSTPDEQAEPVEIAS
jgi:antirestriction protein